MFRLLKVSALLCAMMFGCSAEFLPIHSHNDYERAEPLVRALAENARSIEVDVHLVGGELLVGHDPEHVQPGRTIQKLYLEPLQKHFETRKPEQGGEPLILLVDLKTIAEETYLKLEEVLKPYAAMLTTFENGKVLTNKLQVIASGNRPATLMQALPKRLSFYDGRLTDLGLKLSSSFMPLVSDNWTKSFTWKGEGEFSPSERAKLKELAKQVHAEGKWLRFWASPDNEAAWRELRECGVDLINTDNVSGAAEFLRKSKTNHRAKSF